MRPSVNERSVSQLDVIYANEFERGTGTGGAEKWHGADSAPSRVPSGIALQCAIDERGGL